MGRFHQMPADTKQIVYRAMGGEKTLRVGGGLESSHLSFALPGRLMRDFGMVVEAFAPVMNHIRQKFSPGGTVTAELVRDNATGRVFQAVVPENSYHTLSGRQSFVMMMEATDFWELNDLSKRWCLHQSRFRAVHPQ